MNFIRSLLVVAALASLPGLAAAQSKIAFGNTRQNTEAPVEVSADNLAVNQNDGTALFTGNVLIGQGDMRLAAPKVLVVYQSGGSRIQQLRASGGVTLVSGPDQAEAQQADYNIDTGLIKMSGDVLLVQGSSALTADRMTVDTKSGTAQMQGRVKTVLQNGN